MDGRHTRKGEPITPSAMASLVATELRLADNDNTSEIIGNATDAYNYFLLRHKGDEQIGKSAVQDGAVADVIDAVMAELQPMYTVDELVEVKAEGPDDEDQSKMETKALNWYWRERLRGYERLDEAVQDALLVRNGYLKIWAETSWRLPYETTLEGPAEQVDMQLAALIQQGAQVKEYERVTVQEAVYAEDIVYDETGIETQPVAVMISPEIVSVEIQVIEKTREVKAATIAREDFGTSQDAVDQNLQRPRFCYHRRRMTRNEAVALGFYDRDIWNLESEDAIANQVDNEREEGLKQTRDSTAADTGGDIVSIYECWYKVDADGDGIAELHHIYYGRTLRILRWAGPDGEPGPYADELVRVVPIASGVALRVAHRHLGRSLFDKEKSTEDIKRTLKRQMNDNLYQANDREFIIGPGASEDDFELGFSGGYKRCQSPTTDAVPLPYNPIIQESLQALQYYDSVRSERGGAALANANQEKPTNIHASTFERWMTGTERTTAMYIRNLGNSMIRDAFVLLHQALRTLGEDFDFQDGDQWRKAEPRFWIDRERFSVTLGKSEGERQRLIGHNENQYAKHVQIMENGGDGILTDASRIYEVVTDQANLMGVENHWLDPDRPSGQVNPETGQPMSVLEASEFRDQQAAQAEQQAQQQMLEAQTAQQDKVLAAQMRITELQEQTKRLSDAADQQQKILDRWEDYITKMTKIEADTEKDVPGGVLYGDEELAGIGPQ